MRDQCGTIFRQSRKELESCGLLLEASGLGGGAGDDGSGGGGGTASASSNEESLASDIDRELEILQVRVVCFFDLGARRAACHFFWDS